MPVINTQGSLSSTDEFGPGSVPYIVNLVGAKKIVPSYDGTRFLALTTNGASVYVCQAGGGEYSIEYTIPLPTDYSDTMDGDLNGAGDKLLISFSAAGGAVATNNGRVCAYTRISDLPVTFTDTGDLVTLTNHGLKSGKQITFKSITTTTGITKDTIYYVINPTATTFQVAATLGGAAIALTTNGSGVLKGYWNLITTVNESSTTTGYKFGQSVSVSDGNGSVIGQYSSGDTTPGKYDGYLYYYGNIFSTSATVASTRTQLIRYTASDASNPTWPRNPLITNDGNYVKVHQRDALSNSMIVADTFSVTTGKQVTIPTTVIYHSMSVKPDSLDWSKNKLGRLFSSKILSGDSNVSFEMTIDMDVLNISWGLLKVVVETPWSPTNRTPYIIEVTTDITNDSLSISLSSKSSGTVSVDWGDSSAVATITTTNNAASIATHTYVATGSYQIKIKSSTGYIKAFIPTSGYDDTRLRRVIQWGNQRFYDMRSMFRRSIELTSFGADIPDTSECTDMTSMFYGAIKFNQSLNDWDVGKVKYFDSMFAQTQLFNQPLSQWSTDSALTMNTMFDNSQVFNQDLSNWCVKNITTLPANFTSPAQTLPLPVWGTCPYPRSSTTIVAITKDYSFTSGTTVNIAPVTSTSLLYSHALVPTSGTSTSVSFETERAATVSIVHATGGQSPYVYSISPTLPPYLSLNTSTGNITTPSNNTTSMPVTKYYITSKDIYNNTVTTDIDINVTIRPLYVDFESVTLFYLNKGVAADPLHLTDAYYGQKPYTYSISPAPTSGLTYLNGILSGTPTATGITEYTVSVTDSVPVKSAEKKYTVHVYDGNMTKYTQVNGSVNTGGTGIVSFTIKSSSANEYFKILWGSNWGGTYQTVYFETANTSRTFSITLSTTNSPNGATVSGLGYSYTIRVYGLTKPTVTSTFSVI
jgi:hypothetical protein